LRAAAIGDKVFASAWRLIGVEGFEVSSEAEFSSTLMELIKKRKYSVIIIPESFLDYTENARKELLREERVEPVFVFVPEKGSRRRLEDLKRKISLAIGVSLGV